MDRYYHVGIVVPDLEAAQAYYSELLGLEWGPVLETDVDVRLGDGSERSGKRKQDADFDRALLSGARHRQREHGAGHASREQVQQLFHISSRSKSLEL